MQMVVILRSVLSILVTVAAVLFAIVNRDMAPFVFSPFHEPLSLPVSFIALGGVAVGFLIGGLVVWFNGAEIRKERRLQKKLMKELEKELMKERAKNAENHSADKTKNVMVAQD